MDYIDQLLADEFPNARGTGLASGEIPVWDGAAWVYQGASASSGDVLTWNGTAWAPAAPASSTLSVVTSLPGSPSDGDECIYTDSTTAPTYHWHLRYDTTISGTNKWRVIGATPLSAYQSSSHNTAAGNGVWGAFSTPGPTVTFPLVGSYFVTYHAHANSKGSAGNSYSGPSYNSGSPGIYITSSQHDNTGCVTVVQAVTTAGHTMAGYAQDADSTRRTAWSMRGIIAVPIAVS